MTGKLRVICAGSDDFMSAGIRAGTFAIWDAGASGDDYSPAVNPKSNLSKVRLHSDFDYLGMELTPLTASHTFAAGSYTPGSPLVTINLGAHGQSGLPMMIAEYSLDGTNYFAMSGTTYLVIDVALRGRMVHIQADATNIYVVANQAGTLPAQTVYFRVWLLNRSYGSSRPNNGIIAAGTPAYTVAAFGAFDTRKRYLQTPSPGQTADMTHASGQSIKVVVGSGIDELDIGFGNYSNNYNWQFHDYYPLPPQTPAIIQAQKTELVRAGPGSLSVASEYTPDNFRLSDATGADVFDAKRKMVAYIDEFQTSISVPSRAAIVLDMPHDVVHYSAPVTSGCNVIFAWMKITSADLFIRTNLDTDISSSMAVFGWWYNAVGGLYIRALTTLTVRINGGNLEVVEHYYNRRIDSATTALPAYTANLHIFACATIGGS